MSSDQVSAQRVRAVSKHSCVEKCGYTAGGNAATTSSAAQTAGTYKLVLTSPSVWTATGAGFTFRYAILWDSTTSTPVAYWDYGSSQAVAAGETVTVTLDGTNGVFQAT